MGLSEKRINEYIEFWSESLKVPSPWDYRAKWPRFLFRHEPLNNAVKIIQSGQLLSRDHATGVEHGDIAPADIINLRNDAHPFARLYFRPRNPTQYSVEGVQKNTDFFRGDGSAHAPVLVMFMFSARSILLLPDTHFSNGNMQGAQSQYGNDDAFFDTIQFDAVFHDSSFDPSSADGIRIKKARCAEVLAGSPVRLDQHLAAIMCRSEAERRTLLEFCGELPEQLKHKVRVYKEVGLFQSRFSYVNTVELSPHGLKFKLWPRQDSKDVVVKINVKNVDGTSWANSNEMILSPAKTWTINRPVRDGRYLVQIWLEGHLAYQATLTVDSLPF